MDKDSQQLTTTDTEKENKKKTEDIKPDLPPMGDMSEILTPEMADTVADDLQDMPLEGLDEQEFAEMVAEVVISQMPPVITKQQVEEFRKRYIGVSTFFLKLGGFKHLTANMTLGEMVKQNPWVGWIICGGGMVGCLVLFYPRVPKKTQKEGEKKQEPSPFDIDKGKELKEGEK